MATYPLQRESSYFFDGFQALCVQLQTRESRTHVVPPACSRVHTPFPLVPPAVAGPYFNSLPSFFFHVRRSNCPASAVRGAVREPAAAAATFSATSASGRVPVLSSSLPVRLSFESSAHCARRFLSTHFSPRPVLRHLLLLTSKQDSLLSLKMKPVAPDREGTNKEGPVWLLFVSAISRCVPSFYPLFVILTPPASRRPSACVVALTSLSLG